MSNAVESDPDSTSSGMSGDTHRYSMHALGSRTRCGWQIHSASFLALALNVASVDVMRLKKPAHDLVEAPVERYLSISTVLEVLERSMRKRKRKQRKLLKVSSPRSAFLVRQRVPVHASVFAAALVATPVSVCVFPDYWNDCTGGYTSDRHPKEQSFLGLWSLQFMVVNAVVSAVKSQGRCGSFRAFSSWRRSPSWC